MFCYKKINVNCNFCKLRERERESTFGEPTTLRLHSQIYLQIHTHSIFRLCILYMFTQDIFPPSFTRKLWRRRGISKKYMNIVIIMIIFFIKAHFHNYGRVIFFFSITSIAPKFESLNRFDFKDKKIIDKKYKRFICKRKMFVDWYFIIN